MFGIRQSSKGQVVQSAVRARARIGNLEALEERQLLSGTPSLLPSLLLPAPAGLAAVVRVTAGVSLGDLLHLGVAANAKEEAGLTKTAGLHLGLQLGGAHDQTNDGEHHPDDAPGARLGRSVTEGKGISLTLSWTVGTGYTGGGGVTTPDPGDRSGHTSIQVHADAALTAPEETTKTSKEETSIQVHAAAASTATEVTTKTTKGETSTQVQAAAASTAPEVITKTPKVVTSTQVEADAASTAATGDSNGSVSLLVSSLENDAVFNTAANRSAAADLVRLNEPATTSPSLTSPPSFGSTTTPANSKEEPKAQQAGPGAALGLVTLAATQDTTVVRSEAPPVADETDPSPEGSGMIQNLVPTDAVAAGAVLPQLLAQVDQLGGELTTALMGFSPWLLAVAATALALELTRQRLQRSPAELTLAAGCEGVTLNWLPDADGCSPTEEP